MNSLRLNFGYSIQKALAAALILVFVLQPFTVFADENGINTAPNTPSVSGPGTGTVNNSYSFSASSDDPEGDQVNFGFDWDNDGVVDEYTDYVSVDGFNFGSPWETFDDIFGKALITLGQYKKPIYILSIGSAEGTRKAGWIVDALGTELPKYPLLQGWVWFHENKEKDWRVNSDPASLSAFKSILP